MAGKLQIVFDLKVEEAEADGSRCLICKDLIFLKAFRIELFHGGKQCGQLDGLLCSSCGEEVKKELSN